MGGHDHCCVYGCDHRRNKLSKNCRFFTFPKNSALKMRWIHASGRQNLSLKTLTNKVKVCGCHFILAKPDRTDKNNPDYVPNRNIPSILTKKPTRQSKTSKRSLEYTKTLEAAEQSSTIVSRIAKRNRRQLSLSQIPSPSNEIEIVSEISVAQAEMIEIYSDAKWCKTKNQCLPMDPDLEGLIATTRDYAELTRMWTGWRDVSGAKMRELYNIFANYSNIAVQANGRYEDRGAYLRSWYESPTFEEDLRQLFIELRPLYDQLHAYVRGKLQKYYEDHPFPKSGHIPAHIFGNMWAQKWTNIYDILEPFPGRKELSLTDKMREKGYNVTYMYQLGHDFYTSLGFDPLPDSFWERSMLVKPDDGRKVVCHATAWDMNTGDDFRIKQCTAVTGDQLMTVHHELGHLFYYMAYTKQPFLFQTGANPGFHEAVADIALLSFQSPEYLQEIGIIDDLPDGTEGDINFLFKTALDRVAFLPFGYLIDQWRWDVYRGKITHDRYNTEWWKLRCFYQGIYPPVQRTEDHFDPGSKYHIAGDYPYIRYFVSYVAQFQWHKALCEIVGHQGPLHRCHIFKKKAAGDRLWSMLEMGSSKPWGEAMRVMTKATSGETDKLSTHALLDYFKPLQEWLEKENARTGQAVGWDRNMCPNIDDNHPTSSSQILTFHSSVLLCLVFFCFNFVSNILI